MNQPHVAIVGATGAVGVEMLLCLEQRNFPLGKLKLLASARSAGKRVKFRGEDIVVEELTHDSFKGVDIALFSAGGGISKEFGPSEDSSLSLYLALVRKKIEAHRKYPSWARRKGWEGRAVLEFRIGRDGGLKSIRVIESSGYRILDEAAKEAIEKGSPYPPLPWPQNEFLDARIPIAFRLEENPWGNVERR